MDSFFFIFLFLAFHFACNSQSSFSQFCVRINKSFLILPIFSKLIVFFSAVNQSASNSSSTMIGPDLALMRLTFLILFVTLVITFVLLMLFSLLQMNLIFYSLSFFSLFSMAHPLSLSWPTS